MAGPKPLPILHCLPRPLEVEQLGPDGALWYCRWRLNSLHPDQSHPPSLKDGCPLSEPSIVADRAHCPRCGSQTPCPALRCIRTCCIGVSLSSVALVSSDCSASMSVGLVPSPGLFSRVFPAWGLMEEFLWLAQPSASHQGVLASRSPLCSIISHPHPVCQSPEPCHPPKPRQSVSPINHSAEPR